MKIVLKALALVLSILVASPFVIAGQLWLRDAWNDWAAPLYSTPANLRLIHVQLGMISSAVIVGAIAFVLAKVRGARKS